jgi:NADH-quinone oxidoreductase subunit M
MDQWLAPALLLVLTVLVAFAPTLAVGAARGALITPFAMAALALVSVFAPSAGLSFVAIAGLTAVRVASLDARFRAARLGGVVIVVACGLAVTGFAVDSPWLTLVGSVVAIAIVAGAMPFHGSVASLSEGAPLRLTEQLATGIPLVFAHLRFVAPLPLAYETSPAIVRIGALLTLVPALMALVQPDLRGFYRTAVVMHGGMLLAAVGAAGRGHAAAAMLVVVTMTLALGGLGGMVHAVEERAGRIALTGRGGRIASFPRLAAAFLLFAAAGVGMPGTAGFMADDLLLHALWEESVGGSLTIVVAAALLAVATLLTFSRVFLGPPSTSLAPDLRAGERYVAVLLMVMLIVIGIVPSWLVDPVSAYLQQYGAVPH